MDLGGQHMRLIDIGIYRDNFYDFHEKVKKVCKLGEEDRI